MQTNAQFLAMQDPRNSSLEGRVLELEAQAADMLTQINWLKGELERTVAASILSTEMTNKLLEHLNHKTTTLQA